MHIEFEDVTYQNFMIAGNTPITIPLNKYQSTLMVGENGVGKTTFADALSFGLFGRPLRNLNKPLLVNSINNKNCLVTVRFKTPTGQYTVIRGIKPIVFEIYKNGIKEPMPSKADDYQTQLEMIIGMTFKAFRQIVSLGNSAYIPFMRLPAAGRREIVESLLDIELFGNMSGLCKDDSADIKDKIDANLSEHKVKSEQLRVATAFIERIEEERLADLNTIILTIQNLNLELGKLKIDFEVHKTEESRWANMVPEYPDAIGNQTRFNRMLAERQSDLRTYQEQLSRFKGHDTCPTCNQAISKEYLSHLSAPMQALINTTLEKIDQIQKAIAISDTHVTAHRQSLQTIIDKEKHHATEKSRLQAQINYSHDRLKQLLQEKRDLQTPKPQTTVDVHTLQQELAHLETAYEDLAKQKVIVDAAAMILKDNGIKTRVIKHYLPIINKHINYYLGLMNFPVHFTLDENFDEHIHSSHRKHFIYESFSDGQKQRIDLAILFAWRAVAKQKNSVDTNVLMFDEVFDSSLDVNGTEDFLKLVQALPHTNTIVISHKTDQLIDKFAHTYVFGVNRGFGCVKV